MLHGLDESEAVLSNITSYLEQTYCGPMALETAQITVRLLSGSSPYLALSPLFMLQDVREREWIIRRFEESTSSQLPQEKKEMLFRLMMESQVFDHFLAKKFGTFKRYGAEGAESMLGFFHECFTRAAIGLSLCLSICLSVYL